MLSLSLASVNVSLGPSIVGTGSLVGAEAGGTSTPDLVALSVPWQTLQDEASVFSLLSWHGECSAFLGRESELDELERWAVSDVPISVKFITGEGGVGKSRLAAEFATRLEKRIWSAGFVNLRKPTTFPLKQEGTLLVVDYPEQHLFSIRELLKDLAALGSTPRLRILFLTRRPMECWASEVHDAGVALLVDSNPLHLQPLDVDTSYQVYLSGLERAADICGTAPLALQNDVFVDWFETLSEHHRVLFVVALAVHGAVYPDDPEATCRGPRVIHAMAQREICRLRNCAEELGFRDRSVFCRLLVVAALTGEIAADQLPGLVESEVVDSLPQNLRDLRALLRDVKIMQGSVIKEPSPDILAAAFTSSVLEEDPEGASETVWAALLLDPGTCVANLARLCYDSEVVLGSREAGLSEYLRAAVRGAVDRAELLRPFVSKARLPLGLSSVAAEVWRTLLTITASEADRALMLNSLSNCLADIGDHDGALEAIRNSVEIRQRLAMENPEAREFELAISLNNMSNRLREEGDSIAALEIICKAVEIYRRLVKADPERCLYHLAGSLINLAGCHTVSGSTDAAASAASEAVAILRSAAESQYEQTAPDLVDALTTLANSLIAIGDREAALEVSREAVVILGEMPCSRRAWYEPLQATATMVMANCLSEAGQTREAMENFEVAVRLFRKLSKANPLRYEPDLAMSLNNLSGCQSAVCELERACETMQESVDIYRRAARLQPIRFRPEIAAGANNLASLLSLAGRQDEALPKLNEVVEEYRLLSRERPERFRPYLAGSLANLSNCLCSLGQTSGALSAIREAVSIWRHLSEAHPTQYAADLASAMNNLGNRLGESGDWTGARTALEEAADIWTQLERVEPLKFGPKLAMSLANIAAVLHQIGEAGIAFQKVSRAVEIQRRLGGLNVGSSPADLARYLGIKGLILEAQEQTREAREAFREAADIIRPMALGNTAATLDRLLEELDSKWKT